MACVHVCVNILSSVIKKQTHLVYLETPCRLHTHTYIYLLTDTLMRRGIFSPPLPQSELVVDVFWEAEQECVYLLYESLYNCKKEFVEEKRGEERGGEYECASHASFHY